VAALTRLRQQTFPAIEIPRFSPRVGVALPRPTWTGQLTRQAFFATIVASLVLAAALSVPAILSSRGTGTSYRTALQSSTGVTGTSDTTVGDLSVSTFVGGVPFVQQLKYYNGMTGSLPLAQTFVQGAREADLAAYVQNVSSQVTLPYLNDAIAKKHAIDTWNAAVAQSQLSEVRAAQMRAAASISPQVQAWQPAPIPIGTKLASTTTFYACLGNGFCGRMANGEGVHASAAACSSNLALGTKFRIDGDPSGRVFTCLDRGALTPTWVDVFFYDAADGWAWQANIGTSNTITIVG
jgi:hypothetical protein